MLKRAIFLGLAVLPSLCLSQASKVFLVTTSWDMGRPGEVLLLADAAALRFWKDYAYELSPGAYMAIGQDGKAGLELHAQMGKDVGGQFRWNATGLEGRYLLGKAPGDWGHAVGVEYAASHTGDRRSSVSARYIVGRIVSRYTVMANFTATSPASGGRTDWAYSLGFGHGVSEMVSLGLEVVGGFKKSDPQEAIPQVSFVLPHGGLLKLGIGVAMDASGPDTTFRIGYVGRLR